MCVYACMDWLVVGRVFGPQKVIVKDVYKGESQHASSPHSSQSSHPVRAAPQRASNPCAREVESLYKCQVRNEGDCALESAQAMTCEANRIKHAH